MSSSDFLHRTYGFLKRKIVPNLRYSQLIYEDVLNTSVPNEADWLDVGCGHHLLPQWRLEEEKKLFGRARSVVGLDFDFPSLIKHKTVSRKVQGTADSLPFKSDYFDVATANMVVEHLDDPRVQFAEINRVLKPGGIFVFHTVNETGYFAAMRKFTPNALVKKLARLLDGRPSGDVFEVHYKANREEQIEQLARETNFRLETVKLISSDAVFALVPPLAAIELLWIKLLMRRSMRRWRTNIIVVLRKNIAEK